jgi:hypothetical protein
VSCMMHYSNNSFAFYTTFSFYSESNISKSINNSGEVLSSFSNYSYVPRIYSISIILLQEVLSASKESSLG